MRVELALGKDHGCAIVLDLKFVETEDTAGFRIQVIKTVIVHKGAPRKASGSAKYLSAHKSLRTRRVGGHCITYEGAES
jgi:hypothetical protein